MPNAGSSATRRSLSRTVGTGSAETESEAKRTGLPEGMTHRLSDLGLHGRSIEEPGQRDDRGHREPGEQAHPDEQPLQHVGPGVR